LFHNVSSKVQISKFKIKERVDFRLAGGTIVNLLIRMYPYMNIVGVDIDPVIVDLGRKYFHLDEYKNLKIEIADAFDYIKHVPENSILFSLICLSVIKFS